MAFPIGFSSRTFARTAGGAQTASPEPAARRSVVQVYFPARNTTLAYYNDQFDLRRGDLVYVEGKLEGLQGRVMEVSYHFKIRLSDYKRVIAAVNPNVSGQFFFAGAHFVTFDREALPREQAVLWFKAPAKEDEEFISGFDEEETFTLDELQRMNVSPAIAERGHGYYLENRVRYLSLDGTKGYAIVAGTQPYELEFEYAGGEIRHLVCSCFCSFNCKHMFAAMLQLRRTMQLIEENYKEQYMRSGYFAAVSKEVLFSVAVDGKETGSFTL